MLSVCLPVDPSLGPTIRELPFFQGGKVTQQEGL